MAIVQSPADVDFGFSEFTADNVEEHLPKIISTILEDTNNPNFLQLMTTIFSQLAPQFDPEILDLKLLQHVLPPTRSAFENCLLEIGNILGESDYMEEETAISISKSLQACLDILSGYGHLLDVISKDAVQAHHVQSLNDNLPPILVGAFSHCKDSESAYGVYFEESTIVLTAFFKKSYEIQMKYYKALEDKIIFSSSLGDDFTCLANVLEYVLKTTETVVSLDIKTCVDQWKLYARLYSKHVSDLKSLVDLSRPLALLSSNVHRIIVELTNHQETTEKHRLKLLKMGNFLLKMIVKLCELSECRFREGMKDLVELLLLLHSCTKTYDVNDELKEEIRRFICVGCAPLLSLLLKEDDFFKAFNTVRTTHHELTGISKVGLVFLNLSIMKSIIESKAPPSWSELPLIESVVELLETCGPMVDMNSHFDGKDSYSSMISICSAFMIATTDESSFGKLESFLISKLFNSELHTSLFICDYLCLISRLTSDSYCLHLSTFLCEALKRWPNSARDRPEYNIIGSLAHRLSKLLSQNSYEDLILKYSPDKSRHVYIWICGNSSYAQLSLAKYDDFCRYPTLPSFTVLMANTSREIELEIDPSDYDLISRTFDSVKNVVSFISHHKGSPNQELWCQKVLVHSLKLLRFLVTTIPVDAVVEVLRKLTDLADNSADPAKLLVSMFLSKSAAHLRKACQADETFARSLPLLVLKLMESPDEIVASSAFDFWKSVEDWRLNVAVSSDSNFTERFSSIMNARNVSRATDTFYTVLNSLPEPVHQCSKRNNEYAAHVDVHHNPPAKKFKANSTIDSNDLQVTSVLQRLQDNVSLLKSSVQCGISPQAKIQLDAIIKDLTCIVDDEY